MKVLACAYSCLKDPDQRFGDGGEGFLGWNVVWQLARFHRVHVLTYAGNKEAIEKALPSQSAHEVIFHYFKLPSWFDALQKIHGGIQIYAYLWQIQAYFVAKKLHARHRFDVFHHITYANDWMASFIGALLPVPYVRGPGGGAHRIPSAFLREYSFAGRLKEYVRSWGQWLFRHDPFFVMGQARAKTILACNQEAFDAIALPWKKKTSFFPVNGVLQEEVAINNHVLHEPHVFTVVSVGKLIKLKNIDFAIKAFHEFHKKVPHSQYIIVGDGVELAHLKSLVVRLGLGASVVFKASMPRNMVLQEIAQGDVFLFPSLRDGGGAVVIEAMAQSKPVVCFDMAGPGLHVTDGCGIKIKPITPEQSMQDMVKALETLYDGRELRESMGLAARRRVEHAYLWNVLGDRLKKIYEDSLGA